VNRDLVGSTMEGFVLSFLKAEWKEPSIIRLYQGGRDCMVVGFTTTCAISAYYH
jgi:hypothetical protein